MKDLHLCKVKNYRKVQINKQTFYHLSLFTLYGFGIIGYLIIEFWLGEPFPGIFAGEESWHFQAGYGIVYGIAASLIAILYIKMPFFKNSLKTYIRLVKRLKLTYNDIVFFSFCAAVGEEILFRAAIQPIIGIWPTAVLFVALHGYLTPYNWRLSIYGIFMVLVSAGFGYLYEYVGLFSAITAHFLIDVILFTILKREAEKI